MTSQDSPCPVAEVSPPQAWRQLDWRPMDHGTAELRWHPHTEALQVIVVDDLEGAVHALPVQHPADCLFAFWHPFVYQDELRKHGVIA